MARNAIRHKRATQGVCLFVPRANKTEHFIELTVIHTNGRPPYEPVGRKSCLAHNPERLHTLSEMLRKLQFELLYVVESVKGNSGLSHIFMNFDICSHFGEWGRGKEAGGVRARAGRDGEDANG